MGDECKKNIKNILSHEGHPQFLARLQMLDR
jgi:hypothetical protein